MRTLTTCVQIPTSSCTSTNYKESLQNAGRKCINLDSLALEKCSLFISGIIIRKLLYCNTFWSTMNTLRPNQIPQYLSSFRQQKVPNRNIFSEKDFVSFFYECTLYLKEQLQIMGEIHMAFSWQKKKAWTLAALSLDREVCM